MELSRLTERSPTATLTQAAFGMSMAIGIIDQFDHGILLVGVDARVLHANRVALRECDRHGGLCVEQGRLGGRRPQDAEALTRALAAAARGLRTLLNFEGDPHCLSAVILPLTVPAGADEPALPTGVMLVLLAKRSGTEPLNVELYAQANGLTIAERVVLRGLSAGLDPVDLARANGVAVSTVRTQIMQIRQKTRTSSIRALMNLVNNLPPVVCTTELNSDLQLC